MKHSKTHSVRTRLLLTISLILMFSFLFSSFALYFNTKQTALSTLKKNAEQDALRISRTFDMNSYQNFLDNPTKSDTYTTLRESLNDLRIQNGLLYAYTAAVTSEDKVVLLIDGLPEDEAAAINEPATGAVAEDMEDVLKGRTHTTDVIDDPKYGQYVSVYVPLKNQSKEIIGILGVDIAAREVDALTAEQLRQNLPLFVGLLLLLLITTLGFLYYVLGRKLKPLETLQSVAQMIAEGRLDHADQTMKHLHIQTKDEVHSLAVSIKQMNDMLRLMIADIKKASLLVKKTSQSIDTSTTEVLDGSTQIAHTMSEIASGTESQTQVTLSLTDEMLEFSTLIQNASDEGEHVKNTATSMRAVTEQGSSQMKKSVERMNAIHDQIVESTEQVEQLQKQSTQIQSLVTIIQDIAAQTNLLALNAAIEAARAGEQGKGFAVVAAEVKTLSNHVATSVSEISSIIRSVQENMKTMGSRFTGTVEEANLGQAEIKATYVSFNDLAEQVETVAFSTDRMNQQMNQVRHTEQRIRYALNEIASVAEEHTASNEEVAAASEHMIVTITELSDLVDTLNETSSYLENRTMRFEL
ncbi:methyl-accepting chemotaxis protein [Exiguobacterium flavidum]|uniref:methyl-accepting chemotaxis protein n=1 Tax=Exiguobacterium flavidum TaxID=2184695 RepID=UPI000DF74C9F|nr:HAMP domain-containing methyl-accepting chemotaxis protein [Exiguobacterium flavidum]